MQRNAVLATFLLISIVSALGSTGCSGPADPFETPSSVASWVNSGSTLGIFVRAYAPIAIADGEFDFDDPSCPAVADDGTTVTITGECMESDGTPWSGTAVVVRSGMGDKAITLDAFGEGSTLRTGTVDVRNIGVDSHEFDVEITEEQTELDGSVTTTVISYSGSVEGSYTTPTLWNGSGTLSEEGTKAVTVETIDQLFDGAVCSGAAASGQTTMTAGENTVVVTYDGATDCDADANAAWSLNGKDQGEVSGVVCAVRGVGRRGHASGVAVGLFGAALLGLFLLRRRSLRG